MDVVMLRVDSRLVHGQVIEAWLPYTGASSIVVVDDMAASDLIAREVMKMAVPCDMELFIFRLDQLAASVERVGNVCNKVLLLCRNLQMAVEVVKEIPGIEMVNLGNLQISSGKEEVSPSVFIDDSDRLLIKELISLGVKIEVRAVPSDREVTITF